MITELEYMEFAFDTISNALGLGDPDDDFLLGYSSDGWEYSNYDDSAYLTSPTLTDFLPLLNLVSEKDMWINISYRHGVTLDWYKNEHDNPISYDKTAARQFFKYNFRIADD